MKITQVIVKCIIIIILVLMFNNANAAAISDELVPSTDLFSDEPDPYYITLRELLLGEHRLRNCQIVAIPAFEKEWALYLIKENKEFRLIVKIMKKYLYVEMMDKVFDEGDKESDISLAEAEAAVLSKLPKEVERYSIPISEGTADALEKAWEMSLARVRYKDNIGEGMDGIMYYISHGSRSGTTWSPWEGTLPADLVAIGYSLKELVDFSESERKSKEKDIKKKAEQLIEKIKGLKD
jgi:hypothetical protein